MTDRLDVEIGGYRVHILVDGNCGPVVVLCSGLGGRAVHWSDTVAALAHDHIVVRFDRPGRPTSRTRASAGRTVRGEADRIAAVLDAVHRPDAVVVGHSVGGFYAEGFARLYPHRTRALLLLDSSIAPDHRWLPALPMRARLAAAAAAATLVDKLHLQTPLGRAGLALIQRRRPGGLDAGMRAEIRASAAEPGLVSALLTEYAGYHELAAELYELRAVHPLPPVPRMVATAHTGWRTRRWRTEQIRLAHALDAEHITIAPAGHFVMIEKPARTADLIRSIGGKYSVNRMFNSRCL
ncbi:alpha/beta hydrolase [Mycobacterium kubicae]|uniref:alpha/beta fold hydrolase n=1 Tax=Mycobacterium kubicae TaxID=120959 RepID=UPI0016405602|nr:alpha/beta hydrolase [Mycobacterium kubicae]QNI08068.1 alpha/beta hydrolase [Mycobacterium kubicae]